MYGVLAAQCLVLLLLLLVVVVLRSTSHVTSLHTASATVFVRLMMVIPKRHHRCLH